MDNKRHCSGCDRDLDLNNFAWSNKAKGTYQRWCRDCLREANRVHYQNNIQIYKNRAIKYNARTVAENRKKLYAYLSAHPCVDCGNTDIRCLDFDHVRGKKLCNISEMVYQHSSWEIIQLEIEKCEVRCVNCHRIKTVERGQSWRSWLPNGLSSGPKIRPKKT